MSITEWLFWIGLGLLAAVVPFGWRAAAVLLAWSAGLQLLLSRYGHFRYLCYLFVFLLYHQYTL